MLDITPSEKASARLRFQLKTAYYSGVLPLLCGAMLATNLTPPQKASLERFGLSLGTIFQLRDEEHDSKSKVSLSTLFRETLQEGEVSVEAITKDSQKRDLLLSFLSYSSNWKD